MANKRRKSADYKIKRTFVPVDDGIFLCVGFTTHYATLDVADVCEKNQLFLLLSFVTTTVDHCSKHHHKS